MFEKYMVCDHGFKNVMKNGEVIGFQLRVKIAYYRGLRLSLVEGFEVTVDGERFVDELITFGIGDRSYTLKQMETEYEDRWEFGEEATLTIVKPGGLAPGEHKIDFVQKVIVSYLPDPHQRREYSKSMKLEA